MTRRKVDRSRDRSQPIEKLSDLERIKAESDYLRGTIAEGLKDPITGAIPGEDHQLLKFHGIYQQDDRDLRDERRRQKLEPAYQFMIRVRLPAGICRPDQWLQLDELARAHGDGSLRLTTRQTFQFHGVLKRDLKRTIQGINAALLDTIAACGDDNRGVMCAPLPELSAIHGEIAPLAKQVSDHLLPRTRAYHEIWLDGERVADSKEEPEPIYGRTYLPRKFKIGFAVPPVNDVDIFTQDLGFIAIADGERLAGFNVSVGGGMGRTDNEPSTYPRLGDVIGFCTPDQVVPVAEHVVGVQRDYGDRVERSHARLKYTIDRHGLDWFKDELEARLGFALEPAREYHFDTNSDRYGWTEAADGTWQYVLFVENGRVKDTEAYPLMTGLREIAQAHEGDLRITPNQNLAICGIKPEKREEIAGLLETHGLAASERQSALRRHAMACVAFPTCPLAMAESERYLPDLITKLEEVAAECGLEDVPIITRMSGCHNGCSRPYVAEIAFSGRGPGTYNLYLGGGFHGQRLARLYLENVGEETILETLTPLFRRFAEEREPGEPFGDFLIRAGVVQAVANGPEVNAAA
jgi:sulfite reductase (NADPH) hemoprotein beta-component